MKEAGMDFGSVMLICAKPAENGSDILLQLRECGGSNAMLDFSGFYTKTIRSIREVNALGESISQPLKSLQFKPWQCRFVQLELAP
jgi:hypothetical protein